MPIPELIKFRQKYPQYEDIDDLSLATKLSTKYPEYSDLLDKVKSEVKQPETIAETIPQMLGRNLKKAGQETYREVVSPMLSGVSTFAAGIPKMTAQMTGAKDIIYPEQQTLGGKALRGVSEIAGFTAGLPAKAALFTGKTLATGVSKALPKFVGKEAVKKVVSGAGAGAAGFATAGDTLQNRLEGAKIGATIGAIAPVIPPVAKKLFDWGGRTISTVAGIEKDIYKEASKIGFNKVLKTKYYDKKLPSKIQQRIADNIDNIQEVASNQYDDLVKPLKQSPFDIAQLRGDVIKIANRIKTNPFDTDVSKLDNTILDGIINKAKVNNLGDALDLRRNLDDVIYSNKGELKSSFGKQVRDLLNKELHKNKALEKVDKEWTSFKELLRDGKKILGDTGEKILERFGNMTDKQKQMLSEIEQKIGGAPFIQDLTNYSIAKEFITRKVMPSPSGAIRAVIKPALRGYLRTGEKIGKISGESIETGKSLFNKIQETPAKKPIPKPRVRIDNRFKGKPTNPKELMSKYPEKLPKMKNYEEIIKIIEENNKRGK